MFYDIYEELCRRKGMRPGPAAEACGINRSNVSLWKSRGYTPRSETLQVLADFFGVSVSCLLGIEPLDKKPGSVKLSDEDIKFALFKGSDGVTDEMLNEVKNFAAFIKLKHNKEDNAQGR